MTLEDMTIKDYDYFMDMVDELISMSYNDQELREGIDYLEKRARKKRTSLYEMVFKVLGGVEVQRRLQAWKKEKGFIQ